MILSLRYVTGRPLVGIGINETRYGLFIGSVQDGSGAAEAGLKVGDMIISVDGEKATSSSAVNEIRDKKKTRDYLTFKILRDGETMEISVRLDRKLGIHLKLLTSFTRIGCNPANTILHMPLPQAGKGPRNYGLVIISRFLHKISHRTAAGYFIALKRNLLGF